MKRVILTGASGFIGRHCIGPLVQRGFEIHAIGRSDINDPAIHFHKANLFDIDQIASVVAEIEPTHLLHLSWYTLPGQFWTSAENLTWVQASLSLLAAFAKYGGQRVVMAGTCAEYDWRYGYCNEAVTPLNPTTLYGISKHALQLMLMAFSQQAQVSAAWGRIFFLYGPYERSDRIVSYTIKTLLNGGLASFTHGQQIRDFLYVIDVSHAFVALLDSDIKGAINIASGQSVTVKEIVNTIASLLGTPPDSLDFGAVPISPSEPPLLVADTRRLNYELGWLPAYNLNSGLTHTVQWWKTHNS